jgi:hypothetical protein
MFYFSGYLIILAVLMVSICFAQYFLESTSMGKSIGTARFYLLLIFLLSLGFLFGDRDAISMNQNIINSLNWILSHNILGRNLIKSGNSQFVLAGFLLILKEGNYFIRFVLERVSTQPNTDEKELRAGRIICILERILFYFFMLKGDFAAIGFILAAKGVIRAEEFKKNPEYLLIGTMLSLIYTIAIFLMVGNFIS